MAIEAKGQRVNINGKVTDVLYKDATAREQLANIREQLANIGKTVYPVGAYYISEKSTSPASLFGGTWMELGSAFLYAHDPEHRAGTVGGETEHTLTVDEMPMHRHSSDSYMDGFAATTTGADNYVTWVNRGTTNNNGPQTGENGPVITSLVGGSKPHNNMPPYKAVYMWHRMS